MEKVEEMMTVAICLGAIEGSLDTLKSFNVNDAIFKNNISEIEKAEEQLEKHYKSLNNLV